MAQITNVNVYKVSYKVLTPGVNTNPPTIVAPQVVILVLAATQAAAGVVATTAAGLTGSQTIYIREIQQQPEYSQVWQ